MNDTASPPSIVSNEAVVGTHNGWPVHHGPRVALVKAGLIPAVDAYISWAREASHRITQTGHMTYVANCSFLQQGAVQALAALTFEGYIVRLNGAPHQMVRIHITAAARF
jgi:hypothetical protein